MNSDIDSRYNPSQSLFLNTQQPLFDDLDPISTPFAPEHHKQISTKPFDQLFAEKFKQNMENVQKRRSSKFVVPMMKPTSSEADIDNIFNSQLPNIGNISTSPIFPTTRKSKCFNVPVTQQKLHKSGFDGLQSNKSYSGMQLSNETISKVDNFINQFGGSSGQKISSKITSFQPKKSLQLSPIRAFSHHNSDQIVTVPETPYQQNDYSSPTPINAAVNHSMDDDLILDSDDESRGAIFGPTLQTPGRLTLPPVETPGGNLRDGIQLRSVDEIPDRYRSIFDGIPYFNIVQSKVFDDAFYTDKPLVVCAPTGSGKTIIFELAITRLLITSEGISAAGKHCKKKKPKIVYMAPIKALCSERHEEWSNKFHTSGLECQELTGDSEVDDYWQLQKADIILTTPEKWDSMTRRWRDNSSLVQQVHLFLIDEVHLLNDETRGATMEAVVSRMKTVQSCIGGSTNHNGASALRFVAVSATIPNTEDIAEWLGSSMHPAVTFDMDDSYRPVALRRVVLGYPWSSNGSEFKFDISLNYKLGNVIQTYSDNKPTLVFSSTRKSVEQAASTLAKDVSYIIDASHKQTLTKFANLVRNHRLREMLMVGIGYHHAGLDSHDRHLVEELFAQGDLLVLVSTSTLAMGVNLPAHLVVIKSTCHYVRGMFQEYTQSEIMQMIGRAGRPQFDTTATAVIMTRNQSRDLYHNIVNGSQKIESSLHRHLIEHLNAEIVLTTIHDVTIALEWIRSTFLYIRLLKNPTHYGYPKDLSTDDIEKRLHELCMRNLDSLTSVNLVSIDNDLRLTSSEPGKLMARYCIAFETIKKFGTLSGTESLAELLEILSGCHEFQEINLRMNERTTLNKMNKDKNRVTIRYAMTGRIKTTQMKVNCLLQATLGCINVQDFTLSQDVTKIFRNATRVSRCLVELLLLKDNFKALYNAVLLSKCIKAKLWENSRYISKQLPSIGPSLSNALANAGVCSFERLEGTDPRETELIVNRHPPFGNHLREAVKCLPKYTVHVEQSKRYSSDMCDVTVQVHLSNADDMLVKKTAGKRHGCYLLIGDADNHALLKQRLSDAQMMSLDGNKWQRTVTVRRANKADELSVNLISQDWVGLDVESTYTPYYLGPRRMTATTSGVRNDIAPDTKQSKYFDKKKKPCRHACSNKQTCAHECCKIPNDNHDGIARTQANVAKDRMKIPQKTSQQKHQPNVDHLQKFNYNPRAKYSNSPHSIQVVPSTPKNNPSKTGWEMLDSFCEFQQTQNEEDDSIRTHQRLTPFDREQNYYDEQINLGSRINYVDDEISRNDCNLPLSRKRVGGGEQLWNDGCQVGQDLCEPQLPDIKPHSSKYGFKRRATNSDYNNVNKTELTQNMNGFNVNNEANMNTPSRMGTVFAWKSSTGQKNNMFPCKSSGENIFENVSGNTAAASHWQFDGQLGGCNSTQTENNRMRNVSQNICGNSAPAYKGGRAANSAAGPMQFETKPFNTMPCQLTLPTEILGRDNLCKPENYPSYKQDCSNQLWEQSPSCHYPAYPNTSMKHVTFQDQQQKILNLQNEEDVSINCDFELEEDDDMMMMEACLQAEEEEKDDQQQIDVNSVDAAPKDQWLPFQKIPSANPLPPFQAPPNKPTNYPNVALNIHSIDSCPNSNTTEQAYLPVEYKPSIPSTLQHAFQTQQPVPAKRQFAGFFSACSQNMTTRNCTNQLGGDGLSAVRKPNVNSTKKATEIADARKMFDSIFDGIF